MMWGGESSWMELAPLIQETLESSITPLHVKTQQEDSHLWPRKWTPNLLVPSSRTPASRNVRNKCLLFPSAPICAALLQPLELAKTFIQKVKVLMVQSCPTLCDLMDCSPPGSSVHGDSPGKNTGVDCYFLLQGIFLIQGSNQGLLHCRQILYQLSYFFRYFMFMDWKN